MWLGDGIRSAALASGGGGGGRRAGTGGGGGAEVKDGWGQSRMDGASRDSLQRRLAKPLTDLVRVLPTTQMHPPLPPTPYSPARQTDITTRPPPTLSLTSDPLAVLGLLRWTLLQTPTSKSRHISTSIHEGCDCTLLSGPYSHEVGPTCWVMLRRASPPSEPISLPDVLTAPCHLWTSAVGSNLPPQ